MTRRKIMTKIGLHARALVAIGIAATAAGLGARATWASDHRDAPSLTTDVGADIADVFAFMSPDTPGRMILAMSVHPDAPKTATFPAGVDYTFQITGYDPVTKMLDPSLASTSVSCRFLAPQATSQVVLCSANGLSAYANVGDEDAGVSGAPLRVYAGLRADPAFGDIVKLEQTLTTKTLSFTDAGTNSFAGQNVLVLVVDIDLGRVVFLEEAGTDAGAITRPLLAVSGSTMRLQ